MKAAGRSLTAFSLLGLLAASLFTGCSWHDEFVRRGVVLDSVAARVDRIEGTQEEQAGYLRETRARSLTELDGIDARLSELESRVIDLDERLARIGRKLGVWYSVSAVPDTGLPADSVPPDSGVAPAPDTVGVGPDTVRTGIDPDQLYNTAYLDFTRGKYEVAIAGFEQYLQMFPDTDVSDNAQYWIGESRYSLGDLNVAEEEFKKVLIRHPTGNKVPAATYKLGLVYQTQGREDAARRQFEAVVEKYPGTTEARLAQERLSQ